MIRKIKNVYSLMCKTVFSNTRLIRNRVELDSYICPMHEGTLSIDKKELIRLIQDIPDSIELKPFSKKEWVGGHPLAKTMSLLQYHKDLWSELSLIRDMFLDHDK